MSDRGPSSHWCLTEVGIATARFRAVARRCSGETSREETLAGHAQDHEQHDHKDQ